MSLPATYKAFIIPERLAEPQIQDLPTPKPGQGQILVKVHAASLNPVDWKIHKEDLWNYQYPISLGHDISGEVAAVGDGVQGFSVGDRVFGQGVYTVGEAGFQQYSLLPAKTTGKIPAGVSYDDASTFPVVLLTGFSGLYNPQPVGFGIETPFGNGRGKYEDIPFVVLGGSSTVGQTVIQLAKLSGFSPIIATASIKNAEAIKQLGAHAVIDRSLSEDEIIAKVKEITDKPITYVYDSISSGTTQQLGTRILAPGGHLLIVLEPPQTGAVLPDGKFLHYILGLSWSPENVELAPKVFGEWAEELLTLIKANRVEVLPGGLRGIHEGFKRMERDEVSRAKLVARPQETI